MITLLQSSTAVMTNEYSCNVFAYRESLTPISDSPPLPSPWYSTVASHAAVQAAAFGNSTVTVYT